MSMSAIAIVWIVIIIIGLVIFILSTLVLHALRELGEDIGSCILLLDGEGEEGEE